MCIDYEVLSNILISVKRQVEEEEEEEEEEDLRSN